MVGRQRRGLRLGRLGVRASERRARTRSNSKSRSRTPATRGFQQRGVTLDNLVVSSGSGSTSFEDDGDQLDGWVVADPPEGSGPNENSWTPISDLQPPPPPPSGAIARASFARQPEIIDFLSDVFGSYPFKTAGGIVDNVFTGFALETQTRPVYSPVFFFGGPNDGVVVHELAHQWVGDSLAVERWQHIWLNEGFATYAEWMWEAHEGFATEQEIFDIFYNEIFPAESTDFWDCRSAIPGRSGSSTARSISGAR